MTLEHAPRHRDPLRFAAGNTAEIARLRASEREVLERRAVAPPIEVIRQGDRSVRTTGNFVEVNEAFWLRIRKRPEKDRVDHAEDRAVRANPECERQHGDDREAGRFAELAKREAEVVHGVSFCRAFL